MDCKAAQGHAERVRKDFRKQPRDAYLTTLFAPVGRHMHQADCLDLTADLTLALESWQPQWRSGPRSRDLDTSLRAYGCHPMRIMVAEYVTADTEPVPDEPQVFKRPHKD